MRRILITVTAALAVVLGGLASTAGAQDTSSQNIVQIAQSKPEFSTLVQAVTAAGLAETLSGPGPFTVFAPTNAAFEALPAGTLDTLLEDPTGQLANILKLHVVSGAVDSKAAIAAAGGTVDTLGGPVSVSLDGDTLMVGGAKVTTADITASNGIIHVIDAVITKPATSADASMPSGVDTGTDGLAADGPAGALVVVLAVLAGVALVGVGTSGVVLARARRRS
ncbi:fasciclin domain-containing protein [Dermatobacter hominis]|uniref:fasciclin domain-containing protein n=1 Tax=Dermatobacter hominis TaxID=2884263 RepID=UPI001D11E270|nr:fasciclin domain-containing protein [Dermatobacter hominis]UDY37623.1 fasciclin domain-containing protein [Dermatobacter hominis]